MIEVINFRNAHGNGQAFSQMFELRYRVFIEQQKWDVPHFDCMEYDSYDTPATIYLLSRDSERGIVGMVRTSPTDRPYMIQEVWPGLIEGEIPRSSSIFEGSRFAIDNRLDAAHRTRVKHELVCAFLEFGLMAGITSYVGIMPRNYWNSVFINSGWPVHFLGKPLVLADGMAILAGRYDVDSATLANVRLVTGIDRPVINTPIEHIYRSESLRRAAFGAAVAASIPSPSPADDAISASKPTWSPN